MSLNPAQRAAVEHRGGPLLVLAGAGTGKTRVITHRVAALLDEGVLPWRILAVTFTNKAAAEMRERISRLCGHRENLRELWTGTFHSICARILRRHGESVGLSPRFSIYDDADQVAVMKRVLVDLKIDERMFTPRGVLAHVDRAKNRGLAVERVGELGLPTVVQEVIGAAWHEYQARLRAADAADFGDLLVRTVELITHQPVPGAQLADYDPARLLRTRFLHVVVDEFQDTNPVQAQLIDALSERAQLCVVGDDDQAIYGWRGADVEQILGFPRRHPNTEIIRLEQNYRSTGQILRCADAIISKNQGRLGKTLWSELGPGRPVRVLELWDEREEARLVAQEIGAEVAAGASPEDYAVFYRTHAQSRVLEDEVRRFGLHCRIVGGVAFYERMEVKDVLSWLTLVVNPHSDVHLVRVIHRPARGIGKTTMDQLASWARAHQMSLWSAIEHIEVTGLKKAAAQKLRRFRALVEELTALSTSRPLDELLAEVVERTGYREMLATENSEESAARLENLQELLGNLQEFVEQRPEATVAEYLELVSLVTSEDTAAQPHEKVTLMTVHSAKGLEFEHVYLTGAEERVFPHSRVLEDAKQLEEERRLAYVAVTRAKRSLTVTFVRRRRLYGQVQPGVPSRFVRDLPADAITGSGTRPGPAPPSPTRDSRWNDDIIYDEGVAPDPDFDHEDVFGEDHVGPRASLQPGTRRRRGIVKEQAAVGEGTVLYVGMPVRHADFGRGEVLGWSGVGTNLKLHVRFPPNVVKTIIARFCELG